MSNHIFFSCLILSCMSTVLLGCQSTPKVSQPLPMDEVIFSEEPEMTLAIPEQVSAALISEMPESKGEVTTYQEERFDVSVRDMPAQSFFINLVDGTPYSMVIHPDVTGVITLNQKNTTVPEVLSIIRDIYGYDYNFNNLRFEILPTSLQSRIFIIDYLDLIRDGSSQIKVSAGTVSSQIGGSIGGNVESIDGEVGVVRDADSGSSISTFSQSDFWSEIQEAIFTIIGNQPDRFVTINPQAGLIVVRAMPNELREVQRLIDTTQDILRRQVIIDAKVLEVKLSNNYQAGIDWAFLSRGSTGNKLIGGQIGGGETLSGDGVNSTINPSNSSGNIGNVNPLLTDIFPEPIPFINNTPIQAFGGIFSLAVSFNNFRAFIELLETQGNVQVLSSPRISTLNNQKAIIKVGEDEFFVTNVTNTQIVGGGGEIVTNPEIELTPFFSGIALDVTPQISSDGFINLHIHPTVSTVSEDIKVIILEGGSQALPLAKSVLRESDNIVRAKNGQIVIIGGLMQHEMTELISGIPVLSDIPWMGALFRQTKQQSLKSELVILIRPIVAGQMGMESELKMTNSRLESLRRGYHLGSLPDIFGNEAEYQWKY